MHIYKKFVDIIKFYLQGMKDLENAHQDQQGNVHSELRKEMALLQKKILIDSVSRGPVFWHLLIL